MRPTPLRRIRQATKSEGVMDKTPTFPPPFQTSSRRDQRNGNDDQPDFASAKPNHKGVQPGIECACFLKDPAESTNDQNEQDYVDRFVSPKHRRLQDSDYALRIWGNGVIRAGNRDRLSNVVFFKLLDPNLNSQSIERCLLTGQVSSPITRSTTKLRRV
jgi:hypothetical protein